MRLIAYGMLVKRNLTKAEISFPYFSTAVEYLMLIELDHAN